MLAHGRKTNSASKSSSAEQSETMKPRGRRREFCHSAAPPSPSSRCFDMDGEGVSAE